MTIVLKPEQERVLLNAMQAGLARTPEGSVAEAARRLATFGKRHGLSLGGMTVRQLLDESRP